MPGGKLRAGQDALVLEQHIAGDEDGARLVPQQLSQPRPDDSQLQTAGPCFAKDSLLPSDQKYHPRHRGDNLRPRALTWLDMLCSGQPPRLKEIMSLQVTAPELVFLSFFLKTPFVVIVKDSMLLQYLSSTPSIDLDRERRKHPLKTCVLSKTSRHRFGRF
jgi:hypothetical protein